MYEVFTKLLNMSLLASVLVLAVVLLRIVLKKAPKKIICALWILVAFRLICPISISSSLSVFNVLNFGSGAGSRVEYFQYNEKTEKPALSFDVPGLVNDNLSPDSMTIGTRTAGVYLPTIMYVWMVGVIIMLSYAMISYIKVRREVSASIKRTGNVFVCDEINSPFILGLFRPRIYLPSGLKESVEANVLAHENAHIRRLDFLWKPFGFLLLSVYWFNPVLWAAYILFCRDIEAACDEKVIEDLDKEGKAHYSEALLACASGRKMITVCPLAFGETDVKGRVKNVLNYKKPAFWIIIVSIVALVVVAICFITNPKQNVEADEQTIILDNIMAGEELIEEDKQQKYLEYLSKNTEATLMSMDGITSVNAKVSSDEEGKYSIKLNLYSEEELSEELLGQVSEYLGKTYNNIEVFVNGNATYLKSEPNRELPRAVMVNGEIYFDTDQKSTVTGRCGNMDGNIDSECDANELPTKNNQGNFGTGYGFQYGPIEGTIEIKMEDENWYVFATERVIASSQMHVSNENGTINEQELVENLSNIVSSIGLENAYPWNNTAEFKEDADVLIKLAEDASGRYEIYGIISQKYGDFGFLLNDRIGGEDNWNFEYLPWFYSGAPSDQPILEPDGNGKYIFSYVYKYDDGVPLRKEATLDCGYDTGHMELIN